ncbi:polysaccharide pyruvyl transferase family protein [Tamlana fucoidanivorans]|uniref:Polysaccharide pyruvyl transferase family protein n=1 Tax=Allotamlana fucoidanivorans TaxID=2583814 RepID=A0A5C4SHU4_9FLAO|nr:polysaccharide pyruvyl transferase family protein [Tamlana fucoidanivorans]TNJ43181.1 polysaccharide pyruvyl transferase family protein [Tamlana fucoidanivorans]
MQLVYYKSKSGNFGDDLNIWMWPQIFGSDFLQEHQEIAFFGIGSILMEDSVFIEQANTCEKKVVFGTGIRSINENIKIDDSWHIFFLRGPYSSLKLKGNLDHYIADAAYFLTLLPQYKSYINTPKKYKISFIPYFMSVDKVDWQKICDDLSWNLILPTDLNNVEEFITEIAASEQIISEAMHGAMIADIVRVPWVRFRFYSHLHEGTMVSEWKWNDWLLSIGFHENKEINIGLRNKKSTRGFIKKRKVKSLIYSQTKNIDESLFRLSSDETLNNIVKQLKSKKEALIRFID